jgi:myo-inositol 2-dehydrogenase / D-chiro-inositol 1-dehydrogenase
MGDERNPMSLRVGVIGAGIMGADHVRTLHRFVSGASVEAVADVDAARAQQALTSTGAGGWTTTDPLALIADPRVDAVVIASTDATHARFIQAAVSAGKPVLSEKPLAPSLDEALLLQQSVGRQAGLVTLGFMRRFDPGYARLKAAIDGRSVGRPLLLHCVSRGVSSAPGTTTESSVSNSLVHELDVVPWLLGSPVVQVSWHAPARTAAADSALQDPQLVLLRTADGVLTSCETFLNAGYGYDIRCEVVGAAGAISLAEPGRVVLDGPGGRSLQYGADWRPRFADAYRLQFQAWVDGLVPGAASSAAAPATLADGVRAAAVAAAVVASMHAGGRATDVEAP